VKRLISGSLWYESETDFINCLNRVVSWLQLVQKCTSCWATFVNIILCRYFIIKSRWPQKLFWSIWPKLKTKLVVVKPLTPVLPVTAWAKNPFNFPCHLWPPEKKKTHGDSSLSYPPWRLCRSLIVLLFLRTNKPIRIYLLSIFVVDSRDPRKTVFLL